MMIKNTPDELGIPKFDIECHSQAAVLARAVPSHGVSDAVMLTLAKRVIQELPESDSKSWKAYMACLVGRYLCQPSTDRIEASTQEATHKIIDGAHLFQGYEAPERPDYFPGA